MAMWIDGHWWVGHLQVAGLLGFALISQQRHNGPKKRSKCTCPCPSQKHLGIVSLVPIYLTVTSFLDADMIVFFSVIVANLIKLLMLKALPTS